MTRGDGFVDLFCLRPQNPGRFVDAGSGVALMARGARRERGACNG